MCFPSASRNHPFGHPNPARAVQIHPRGRPNPFCGFKSTPGRPNTSKSIARAPKSNKIPPPGHPLGVQIHSNSTLMRAKSTRNYVLVVSIQLYSVLFNLLMAYPCDERFRCLYTSSIQFVCCSYFFQFPLRQSGHTTSRN